MANNRVFDEQVGLLRTGAIVGYDSGRGILKVKLNTATSIKGQNAPVEVQAPHPLFYNNGLFIGTLPIVGTPVVVGQSSGGGYYFVSFLAENLPVVPTLNLGELLLQSNSNTKITLDATSEIGIGGDTSRIHIDTDFNLITTNFYNENHFTQAARRVEGLIKRDLKVNTNYDPSTKLENDTYDPRYFVIGLDPTVSPNPVIAGSTKNPPFVEQREMIYEFQYYSDVNDDLTESALYGNTKAPATNFTFPDRRASRADTLSLTLLAPNFLMETVKGTVVDIFGNILDLNRYPLPVGTDQNTLKTAKSTDKVKSFQLIKELERKSIAYHFEINARKDLTGQNGQEVLPDITSNADYARSRSRFFMDIDKEGQFKINVPASSNKGNVPLLTRYENYSSFGSEDNNNPNKLVFRDDNLDIFLDSFAASAYDINAQTFTPDKGSINLVNNGQFATPNDRITQSPIKHGTAFHDVLATCYAHQKPDYLKYILDQSNPLFSAISSIPPLTVCSDTIDVGGDSADGGGRSGSINLDGSLDLNIGANSVDRQSLWLDTAGGIVANIGRDVGNMSAALSMNGDVFVQVGGMGVSTDSRFVKKNNGQIGAALDIRVFNAGLRVTMIRIDDSGVKIMTPGNLFIHGGQGIAITSDADISISCETLKIQERAVMKVFGGSV